MLARLASWSTDKPEKDWKEIVVRKKAERESRLPEKWLVGADGLPSDSIPDVTQLGAQHKWLNEQELAITNLTAVDLAHAIKEGRYTAVAVIEAYAHRATIAQQLVNPLTEINFEQASKEAEDLDEHLKKTGMVVGPMHGVPISVKDQFRVKGLDTTVGYCAWPDNIADSDSILVDCLKKAGAIVLTKTNVGQSLMSYEAMNPIWGRSLNPYNRKLTPGGSSGGESALLAMRGSAIGIGSDYGGSIRGPASYCGLYGLRPSWGRVSFKNTAQVYAGLESRRTTPGPLGRSPDDINLFMSAYMAAQPWKHDPDVLPIPWRTQQEVMPKGPLCFAVAYGDEEVTPHPPIMRALRLIVKQLQQAGHIVVEWHGPLRTDDLLKVGHQFTLSGGKDDILNIIKTTHEPISAELTEIFKLYEESTTPPKTPYEIWQLQVQKQNLVDWFHDTWQSTHAYSGTGRPIDGLIMPVNVCVASPHFIDTGSGGDEPGWGYADCSAILDVTSAAFPTDLRQDPNIDVIDTDFKPRSAEDKKQQDLYGDPTRWTGAPIGLQVIGQRLEEEKVVGMLCAIQDAMKAKRP